MMNNATTEQFENLLEYYIKCIEKEDMLSLTFNLKSDGKKFHSNFFQKEEFFLEKKEQVHMVKTKQLENFIEEYKLVEKNKSIFYGYPIFIDSNGTISPIFYVEIFYEEKDDGIIFTKASSDPEINHYILKRENFSIEEIEKIITEVGEEDSFISKLEKIIEILNLNEEVISPTYHNTNLIIKPNNQIISKAILYTGVRSGIVYNLLLELNSLRKKSNNALESSSLSYFFGELSNESTKNIEKPIIEVFPINTLQEQAIKNALSKNLTVVTGPPGTGKSQVVLNIIANAIMNNKTVLFASKNNKAVDVVIDKFDSILSINPIIRMGSRYYRNKAREKFENLLIKKDEIKTIEVPEDYITKIIEINQELDRMEIDIRLMSDLNNSIDKCYNKMNEFIKELPLELYISVKEDTFDEFDKYKLQIDIDHLLNDEGFFIKLLKILFPKWYKKRLYKQFNKYYLKLPKLFKNYLDKSISFDKQEIIKTLRWILCCKNIDILKNEINEKKERLSKSTSLPDLYNQITDLHKERLKLSVPLFVQKLNSNLESLEGEKQNSISRYFDASEKLEKFIEDINLWRELGYVQKKEMQELLKHLPVWVVTNLSVKDSVPFESNLFDILIIDEASQCDIASALPLIFRAKQIVIIGDPKQLKHISLLKESIDKRIASENNIEKLYVDYSYGKNSLYDLAERIIIDKDLKPLLLTDHYRSHMDIINFSNENFYENKLNILTNPVNLISDEYINKRVLWNNVQGRTIPSKSPYCLEEAEEVVDQIIQLLKLFKEVNVDDFSFGVVTLFRSQMELIEKRINESEILNDIDITVGTAHRFQGDEKDIIIFSPAISEGAKKTTINWIHSTQQLLNVAVTRARSGLVIVGDKQKCSEAKGILQELVDYSEAKKNNVIVFDSNIEKILYDKLLENDIKITPQYWTKIKDKKAYRLDFALFVNSKKFDIEVDGDKAHSMMVDYDILRDIHLRMEGWNIRRFGANKIQNQLNEVVDEIKRMC